MSTNPNTRQALHINRKLRVAAALFTLACATLVTGVGDAAERVALVEYFTNLY